MIRRRGPRPPPSVSPPVPRDAAATTKEQQQQSLPSRDKDAGTPSLSSAADSPPPPYTSIATPPPASALTMLNHSSSWMVFAVASGTCAAFNGVFAKLTTTELTTTFAASIAEALGLSRGNGVVEFLVRASFFSLNLAFNALMWVLFTRALTLHTSTTQVSILNVSANFLFTAILGFLVFSESLPPLWFAGAAMLVVGNVVIGRNVGEKKDGGEDGGEDGIGEGGGFVGGVDGSERRGEGEELGMGKIGQQVGVESEDPDETLVELK